MLLMEEQRQREAAAAEEEPFSVIIKIKCAPIEFSLGIQFGVYVDSSGEL